MRSSDQRDTELVNHLLGIKIPASGTAETEKSYETYVQWLNDNDPFLYFTNESLQLSSRPVFYRVDLERKYVDRGIPSYDRQPIVAADDEESRYLAAFNTLGHEEKTFLSDYSHKFHQENPAEWKRWVQYPIDEQIKSAKLNRERFNDHSSWTFV